MRSYKSLLQVLRDAQQEVPDWFLEEAGTDVASGTTVTLFELSDYIPQVVSVFLL